MSLHPSASNVANRAFCVVRDYTPHFPFVFLYMGLLQSWPA